MVRVHWGAGQEKPAVRTGGWVFDATMVPTPHGFFYRVVNIIEGTDGIGPYVDLELQTNPKAGGPGVLMVLDGVAEVFEKGPGWRP